MGCWTPLGLVFHIRIPLNASAFNGGLALSQLPTPNFNRNFINLVIAPNGFRGPERKAGRDGGVTGVGG